MTAITEKKSKLPGPSELLCKVCGAVEMIRMDWQRCYLCYMHCETRNTHTYPAFCTSCHLKLH